MKVGTNSICSNAIIPNKILYLTETLPFTMVLHSIFILACSMALALGASLQQVSNFGENPSNIRMYIYVPDNVAANPAVIVAVS